MEVQVLFSAPRLYNARPMSTSDYRSFFKNASRGSLLVPVLLHFWGNGPMWPDGHPWGSVFLIGMAVVVVVVKREAMFSREGAATEVCLPPAPVLEPRSQT